MQRKVFLLAVLLTIAVGGLMAFGLATKASGSKKSAAIERSGIGKPQGPLTVSVAPAGPSQAQADAAVRAARAVPAVKKYLDGAVVRQLQFELLDMQRLSPQQRYRVTFYDYTRNRPVVVESALNDTSSTTVAIGTTQPLPTPEEFDAAVETLKKDPNLGPLLKSKGATTYRPMPPLGSDLVGPERTLHVGMMTVNANTPNRIVGVNMISGAVTVFDNNAPPISRAAPEACGVPGAGQGTTSRNTPGQYNLTISAGGSPVWQMLIIRPSASSGTRASAIEIRDVYYLGKLVFKRAHVPILNVKYDNDACGPYRDWQWQEGMFVANGTDVASGIRSCTSEPQTILENNTDTGNFRGVAIYQTATSVMLLSEIEAGWYRYVSRWEFDLDGTIRPRFGFDGVNNSCVCNLHHHHIYWRFDFDVATAGRNRFVEYDTRSFGTPLLTEAKRYRDYVRGRYWTIENLVTGEMFRIDSGPDDGTADTYARGDAWFLRYRSTELDDGVNTTGPNNTEAKLDNFVNGESINEQDVVMWYSANFDHSVGEG
ncbi:MAG: hypothetical protein ABI977_14700, partial [Acidobacteriota bacterium]